MVVDKVLATLLAVNTTPELSHQNKARLPKDEWLDQVATELDHVEDVLRCLSHSPDDRCEVCKDLQPAS